MKLLVETSGSFGLIDGKDEIDHDRPSVANNSSFVQTRIAKGQLKVLGKLKDEATDLEFAKYVAESKGDTELAVSSFLSAFGVEEITEKKPAGKRVKAQDA